jgi:plasmid maintenance system antidote protein VapI
MKAGVTADMALRLSAWLGTIAEMRLGMHPAWDLWQAERHSRQIDVKPIRLTA